MKTKTDPNLEMISRRTYLTVAAMDNTGCSFWVAAEAVASTAIEHPEWDMDEQRTWQDWERDLPPR